MKHPLRPPKTLVVVGQTTSQTALPRQFRLCCWNWHKCKHPQWAADFTRLCAQTDLFLAQEVRLSPTTCNLLTQNTLQWNAAISFLSPIRRIPTGIAAGCLVAAQEIACYASEREPVVRTPKMTMKLIYPLENTQLLVLHLHAINFTGLTPFERTLEQAAELVFQFKGPVIVAGDFNTWSQKRTDRLHTLAKQLGLQEVVFSPDLRSRFLRRPVDYLFIRGLEVVRAQTQSVHSSDHHPLCALLRLPG